MTKDFRDEAIIPGRADYITRDLKVEKMMAAGGFESPLTLRINPTMEHSVLDENLTNFFTDPNPQGEKRKNMIGKLNVGLNDDTVIITKEPPKPPIDRVLIKAQNVHDYYLKHWRDHGWNDMTNFICAKPPFPEMLITYDHTFQRLQEGVYHDTQDGVPHGDLVTRHVDIIIIERSLEYFDYYLRKESTMDAQKAFGPEYDVEGSEKARLNMKRIMDYAAPWSILELTLVADLRKYPGRFFVMLDKLGRVLSYDNYAYFFIQSPEEIEYVKTVVRPVNRDVKWAMEKFRDSLAHHSCIALATLQFMNLRNVEIVVHAPRAKWVRRAIERGKKPPITFRTLVIHPIGKRHVYQKLGEQSENRGCPLTIVRGHLKDYRNGRGLGRGHGHGLWWWSPQVRGSLESGKIVKDYNVKPTSE